MPFKSEKQKRWMHANKPKMAKRWEKDYKKGGGMPKNKKLGEKYIENYL